MRLREIREARAFSQRGLSKSSGVAQDTISDIERGLRKPHPSTIRKLARALEVEVEDITGGVTAAPKESGSRNVESDEDFVRGLAAEIEAAGQGDNRMTMALNDEEQSNLTRALDHLHAAQRQLHGIIFAVEQAKNACADEGNLSRDALMAAWEMWSHTHWYVGVGIRNELRPLLDKYGDDEGGGA